MEDQARAQKGRLIRQARYFEREKRGNDISIQVADKIIETDEEGYLVNAGDWSEAITEAMVARQSRQDHVELSETQLGLVQYFRE